MAEASDSTHLPAVHGPVTAAIHAMRSEPEFTTADIDTAVNCEPRVLDTLLGERLGMAQPLNIRAVIEGAAEELAAYGPIFTARVKKPGRGRPGTAYYLSEGQALCVCALSRAPNAAQVRRALIEAFMVLRRQKLEALTVAAGRQVAVRPHTRALPRPEPKNGRGCAMIEGRLVHFQANGRLEDGALGVVIMRDGKLAVAPVFRSMGIPEPGFGYIDAPVIGRHTMRWKLPLVGAVVRG